MRGQPEKYSIQHPDCPMCHLFSEKLTKEEALSPTDDVLSPISNEPGHLLSEKKNWYWPES
jgi:hypothetical protein